MKNRKRGSGIDEINGRVQGIAMVCAIVAQDSWDQTLYLLNKTGIDRKACEVCGVDAEIMRMLEPIFRFQDKDKRKGRGKR